MRLWSSRPVLPPSVRVGPVLQLQRQVVLRHGVRRLQPLLVRRLRRGQESLRGRGLLQTGSSFAEILNPPVFTKITPLYQWIRLAKLKDYTKQEKAAVVSQLQTFLIRLILFGLFE